MGASSSSPLADKAPLLAQLGSTQQIAHNDSFWKLLLSHGPCLATLNPHDVEEEVGVHFRHAAAYNPVTHNCQTLLVHTISLLNDVPLAAAAADPADVRNVATAAANALHMVGLIVKAASEEGLPSSGGGGSEAPTHTYDLFEVPPALPMPEGLVRQG